MARGKKQDRDFTPRILSTPDDAQIVDINTIKAHPSNPREGDIGAIIESMKHNGFYGFLIVQKSTSHILAGNHRWQAAKQLGLPTVPVIWLDCNDEHALRILLADNKTNDNASYNEAQLIECLEAFKDDVGDLEGTGWDEEELNDIRQKFESEGEPEEVQGNKKRHFIVLVDFKSDKAMRAGFRKLTKLGFKARVEGDE